MLPRTRSGTNGESEPETPTPSSRTPSNTFPVPPTAAFFGPMSPEIAKQIHEEFLICKICLDAFDTPKSLACLHTFCQRCIENHISAEVTYNKVADYHNFNCPLCRKHTNLPIGGVRKLPDNFFVSGLADMLSRNKKHSVMDTSVESIDYGDEDSVCGPLGGHRVGQVGLAGYGVCEICGQMGDAAGRGKSSTPSAVKYGLHADAALQRANSAAASEVAKATSKCLDCNKLLCQQCASRHKEIRVTQDHAIFDLRTESNIACKDHPEEQVRFYCEACSACICILCTFNNHREHEMTSFGEAINKLRGDLKKKVNETHVVIERARKWLAVIDDATDMVHKVEGDVRECADRAIDEIHRQEDQLIEQLHAKVGRSTMQTIERAPELECELSRLEVVQTEVTDLLEGQDINVLLTKSDIKEKLAKLSQFEVTGVNLPVALFPKTIFMPQAVYLGQLVFPDDGIVKPLSTTAKKVVSIGLPASTQTEQAVVSSVEVDRPTTVEKSTEVNAAPSTKHVRHRASNTDRSNLLDQETNTRPRGIQVSITYGGDEQVGLVESYLSAIQGMEESGDGDVASDTFANMDNLTRARVRRKLKERWSTVDVPDEASSASATPTTPAKASAPSFRRFSDYHHAH